MLSPVDLHDLALTLENERAFHDAYNSKASHYRSDLQRRELIKDFIPTKVLELAAERIEVLSRYVDEE